VTWVCSKLIQTQTHNNKTIYLLIGFIFENVYEKININIGLLNYRLNNIEPIITNIIASTRILT